jgi:hypothetical protein
MKLTLKGKNYWQAGLLAGVVAAILNVVLYLIMIGMGGHDWALVIVGSILVASLLPNLIAALAYYGLGRLTRRPRPLLTIAVGVFVLISVLPHLGIGPAPSPALEALPEGFDLLTIPLHIVFGLTAVFIMPWLVAKN